MLSLLSHFGGARMSTLLRLLCSALHALLLRAFMKHVEADYVRDFEEYMMEHDIAFSVEPLTRPDVGEVVSQHCKSWRFCISA